MNKDKRVYYKAFDIKLNGVLCPTATVKKFETNFNLEQVFCNCPAWLNNVEEDEYERWTNGGLNNCMGINAKKSIRYTDCACARNKTLIRPMDETEFRRVGCKGSYHFYLERFTKDLMNEHNN